MHVNLVPENVRIIFVFVNSFEGVTLFRGKGHYFWAPKPGLIKLHSMDTLALKTRLTKKGVDIFKSSLASHNDDRFHYMNYITQVTVLHV